MERRSLLASAVSGTTLTLTGTGNADAFVLTRNGGDVIVSENGGAGRRYASASIMTIRADLGNGHDYLDIADNVTQAVLAYGEGGNDTILSGGGDNDTLDGGAGNDLLDGGAGTRDTASYVSSANSITAVLRGEYRVNTFTGLPEFITSGNGGGPGENDTYAGVEAIHGGTGGDSLRTEIAPLPAGMSIASLSAAPTLALKGGGGFDTLSTNRIGQPTDTYAVVPQLLSGDEGRDSLGAVEGDNIRVTLAGGADDDHYSSSFQFSAAQVPPTVIETSGVDSYWIRLPNGNLFTLPDGVENLTVVGQVINVRGNSLANNFRILDGAASVKVDGAGGNDYLNHDGFTPATLLGGTGDDTLSGSTGADTVDGGEGIDTVTYAFRVEPIDGALHVALDRTGTFQNYSYAYRGHGTVTSGSETDTFDNIESLVGSAGNDSLNVTADDSPYWQDVPGFERPSYAVDGGAGDDDLGASTDYSFVVGNERTVDLVANGGQGNDTLTSYEGLGVKLFGGEGDDQFVEFIDDSPLPQIDAGPGLDLFTVDSNLGVSYTMPDGLENIDARGGSYNGVQITGNDLANHIIVSGGGSNDFINARGGNDTIVVSNNTSIEFIDGGGGLDTISHVLASDPITFVMRVDGAGMASGSATLSSQTGSFSGVETILGSDFADTFTLNFASTNVTGAILPIRVQGGAGNDLFNFNGLLTRGAQLPIFDIKFFVDGEAGNDRIVYTDAALAVGGNYLLLDISGSGRQEYFQRTTANGLNGDFQFAEVEAFDLTTTRFADTIRVSDPYFSRSVISTGDGVDSLTVDQAHPAGDINFISGAGDDTLKLRTPSAPEFGAAVVRLYQAETLGSVYIGGGGVLQIAPTPNEASVLRVREFLYGSFEGYLGRVDPTNNPLIIDYTGSVPPPNVLRSIRSSIADAEATPNRAYGSALSTDLFTTFPATFAGQSVDNTAVLFRFTVAGDINLDRQVNFNDLVILAQNYNLIGRRYSQGNLNYSSDGKVDFDDLVILAQNYSSGLSSVLSAFAQLTVPVAPTVHATEPKKRMMAGV